jgi:dihydroxy-acid dehydratase
MMKKECVMAESRTKKLRIKKGTNPYSKGVQGKANEPICVEMLLDRAKLSLKRKYTSSLEEIYDRLENNAPRIAIITGSPDQPAHIMDHETMLKACASIWERGGVPFAFGIPVMCDGTAQSNFGMCYSLASRNLVSSMVINQMESHHYHGAFVIQGCDKTPFGVLNGLASLDRSRQLRGEAPVFATFAPAHVLKGGKIPDQLKEELFELADMADFEGMEGIGDDIRHTINHILQCSSNQAFQGVLTRAVQSGLITHEKHKEIEKQLAVNTCDSKGGICAFNGTGNSSRHVVSAFGMVHPELELLTHPPTFEQIDKAVDVLIDRCNDPSFSVSSIVEANVENAVRIHSTMGCSTNIMMHMISCMIYSGYQFSIHDSDKIRQKVQVPDLMNYSLTEGRDIFALAQQCCDGLIGGIETALYELNRNGVPIRGNAKTMAGKSWTARFRTRKKVSAGNVKNNPIILSRPRRSTSGVDVLSGNIFESAIVKISGMPETQLNMFDEKVAVVLYFETEEEAVSQLLNVNLLDDLVKGSWCKIGLLQQIYQINTGKKLDKKVKNKKQLFQLLLEETALRIAVIVSGQGPEAYGMPEMFTPMQHINHNQVLKKIVTLISDGRYSGVSYGAAIGHVTPEAIKSGGILYLKTGDLLQLRLRNKKINLLDDDSFNRGKIKLFSGDLAKKRKKLGDQRLKALYKRKEQIDPTNWMDQMTDAAHGVVPIEVWNRAKKKFSVK